MRKPVVVITGAGGEIGHGLIANAKPGTILIDMTTSSPELAATIHAQALSKGQRALDAHAPSAGPGRQGRFGQLGNPVGGEIEWAHGPILPRTRRGQAGSTAELRIACQPVTA